MGRRDHPRQNRLNAAEFVYDMWKREDIESNRPHAQCIIRAGFTHANLIELEKDDHGVPCSLCQALREELAQHHRLYEAAQADSRQLRLPFPPAPIGPIGEDLLD